MSAIFGLLNVNDADYAFVNQLGQQLVLDATNQYLERATMDMEASQTAFVETVTENYKERYKLPGGGQLQLRSVLGRPGEVKAYNGWDVAYPLYDYGAAIATNDIDMAYMSPAEYQRHVDTVMIQYANTVRFNILKRLFKNTTDTYTDPRWGSLTIQCLANGDAVVYPPVLGSDAEATDTHYLESGYAASGISDAQNPLVTMYDELIEHFGIKTGGENVATFINTAQKAKISALTGVDEVIDSAIRAGANTNMPVNLPNVPGKIFGYGYGTWIVEWPWIPANYMVSIHLDEPAPLKMRVDPAATGLGRGLQLVSQSEKFPLTTSFWRARFGMGAGNRLNGVVMELGTSGAYTIPTAYQ